MMTTRAVLAIVMGATVCAAALTAAQAQAPRQQPPVFRTNTELVEIDVVVVDKNGARVHGLTKDDFVLRDRRQPQTIETFTEVRRDVERMVEGPRLPSTVRVDVASNSSAQAGRLVVLVLDDLHVWQGRTDTVKDIARKVVTELGPESSMALIQTGGDHSTEVTEDRTRLLESIDRFKGRRPVRRPLEACDPQPIRRDPENPEIFDPGCDIQDVNANRGLYQSMEDAARILGQHDRRRKAFILVSEHVAKDISGLFDGGEQIPKGLSDSSGYMGGNPGGLSSPTAMSAHDYALLDLMNAMRRGNVTTYAIDPRGKVTPQEMLQECLPGRHSRGPGELGIGPDPCEGNVGPGPQSWNAWVRQAQQGLSIVSEETGGFAVVDTDDFTSGVTEIIGDIDNFYLLGFYAADLTTKGYRPISVEVRGRPELTLRYRRGYEVRPDDDGAKAATRDALAVLIDNPLPASELPLRMHAIPMPDSGNRSKVAISLELTLPRGALASDESERLLDDIRYGVYAIDLKGAKVREHVGSGARVALRPRPGLTVPPDRVTYQIALELDLPAGRYQLRASALSDKLKAGGSVYLSLDVPDFSKVELGLTELLLAFADGPRVPVARDRRDVVVVTTQVAVPAGTLPINVRGLRPSAVGNSPSPPVSALPFDPALDRTFTPADTLRLYFKAVQRQRAPVVATVSALTADGATVVTFDRNLPADGTLDVRLPLAQLTPGAYVLRVAISDGARTSRKEVGFVVEK
jgi:VWFA-related protein